MARFDSTAQGSPGGFVASLIQLLDMTPFASQVSTDDAQLVITAAFNRVVGDAQTDTEFHVAARAYNIDPDDFLPAAQSTYASVSLLSDGDVASWQEITLTFDVPVETTFVALDFRAIENIDESDSPELDGHYVDGIHVELVTPDPHVISDLTGNGFVDFQDLTILLSNWNKPDATVSQGNIILTDSTSVDFLDLTFLLSEWTGSAPAGSPEAALGTEAVPEPSTMLLALLATLGLSFYRRRRRRAF